MKNQNGAAQHRKDATTYTYQSHAHNTAKVEFRGTSSAPGCQTRGHHRQSDGATLAVPGVLRTPLANPRHPRQTRAVGGTVGCVGSRYMDHAITYLVNIAVVWSLVFKLGPHSK